VIKEKPPEQILECKDAPECEPAEEGATTLTDKEIAVCFLNMFFAWKDCNSKLEKVREFHSSK